MKSAFRLFAVAALTALSLAGSSCTNSPTDSTANKNQAAPVAVPARQKTLATGTLTANPSPIKVCDKSGTGVTTISWAATGTDAVEVHTGRPDGDVFVSKAAPVGKWQTSKWVGNGMTFYLQDVSGGKPLTADNTIATLTVTVTSEGCP